MGYEIVGCLYEQGLGRGKLVAGNRRWLGTTRMSFTGSAFEGWVERCARARRGYCEIYPHPS